MPSDIVGHSHFAVSQPKVTLQSQKTYRPCFDAFLDQTDLFGDVVQRSNTELVPIYGYSPSHIRIICIKENPASKAPRTCPYRRHGAHHLKRRYRNQYLLRVLYHGRLVQQAATDETMLSSLALFEFQKKMLDEEIFLDIERARYLKLYDGNHTRQIDAPRIQIWRESRSGNAVFDDNMSHYTVGTMLSGPLKDRVAPTVSRLIVYLGRSEEYLTTFSEYLRAPQSRFDMSYQRNHSKG